MCHSHIPKQQVVDGVLHLNPGSTGPKRFKNPISYALLELNDKEYTVEIVEI